VTGLDQTLASPRSGGTLFR